MKEETNKTTDEAELWRKVGADMQLTGFHSVFDCHRPPISRINIVLKKLETFIAMLELAFDTNWKETRSFMDVFGNDLNETFLESLRSYCNTEPTDITRANSMKVLCMVLCTTLTLN